MQFEFSICRQLQDTIQRLSSKEVNPAVQESKEFKYKIKELEKKIRDMTNVIEEYPRDFEHSLLFFTASRWRTKRTSSRRPRLSVRSSGKEGYGERFSNNKYIRKNLGIRREMIVSGLSRLIPTECEVRSGNN